MSDPLRLSIHGVGVAVRSAHPDIAAWLAFDFDCFLAKGPVAEQVRVDAEIGPVPPDLIPPIVESMHSPKFVCYDDRSRRWVDYYGRAVVVHDYATESATLWSADPAFAYEKLYLLILSRVGEILDRRGLHRVHALGLAVDGGAALFLIPERGGKSTLGLSMLGRPGITMISDDSPLIDAAGRVHPFPLRIGVRDGEVPAGIPASAVRAFPREDGGVKRLIRVGHFAGAVERERRPARWLFIGKWTRAAEPRIVAAGKLTAFLTLVRDCVFGLGLAQVVEFFLRSDKRDLLGKAGIVVRRLRAAAAVTARAGTLTFLLSRDRERNRQCLLDFLEKARP